MKNLSYVDRVDSASSPKGRSKAPSRLGQAVELHLSGPEHGSQGSGLQGPEHGSQGSGLQGPEHGSQGSGSQGPDLQSDDPAGHGPAVQTGHAHAHGTTGHDAHDHAHAHGTMGHDAHAHAHAHGTTGHDVHAHGTTGHDVHDHPPDAPAHGSESHGHAHGSESHGHAHGLGHAHGFDPTASASVRRALSVALVLNVVFLVVELAVGFWSGSLALLSDAAHMVSDVAALSLALGASVLATKLTHSERTFGLVRAEALGAFVNAIALVVTCGFIVKEAMQRLNGEEHAIAGLPVLLAGVMGLVINLGSAWMLARADRGNLNVRGALLHMLSDALGSLGAIVAAICVMYGVVAADSVVSLMIGVLVLLGTWGLLRDSAAVLLEFSPRGLSVVEVERQLRALPNVEQVHDLHVWSLDGKSPILSAHLVQSENSLAPDILRDAECLLRERFGVQHSTLQIESPSADPCRVRDCCNLLPKQGSHAGP